MRAILSSFACLVISLAASAADLDRISNADAVGGLKQALTDGSAAAVEYSPAAIPRQPFTAKDAKDAEERWRP
jgi:hypothetical protein